MLVNLIKISKYESPVDLQILHKYTNLLLLQIFRNTFGEQCLGQTPRIPLW